MSSPLKRARSSTPLLEELAKLNETLTLSLEEHNGVPTRIHHTQCGENTKFSHEGLVDVLHAAAHLTDQDYSMHMKKDYIDTMVKSGWEMVYITMRNGDAVKVWIKTTNVTNTSLLTQMQMMQIIRIMAGERKDKPHVLVWGNHFALVDASATALVKDVMIEMVDKEGKVLRRLREPIEPGQVWTNDNMDGWKDV